MRQAATQSKKRILFFVCDAPFFVSHRLNLVRGALLEGYHVTVACPDSGDAIAEIKDSGANWVNWKVDRSRTSVGSEAHSILDAIRIVRKFKPDLVHAVAIKSIIYSGIPAKIYGVPLVGAISGLGYIYTGEAKFSKRLIRAMANSLLRLTLNRRNAAVIFQNQDDARLVFNVGLTKAQAYLIGGSGVDLGKIKPNKLPSGNEVVIGLPARLLRDKGVLEFIEAAKITKARKRSAQFVLIGNPDPSNPTSVTQAEIESWLDEGVIKWVPYTRDIGSILANLHVVVLPSYREGFPKTLIDAAAAGRAVVTTDVPGCRDALAPGVTGIICPPRDPIALADAIDQFILDRNLCQKMGEAGRIYAENNFDVATVTKRHMEIYRAILSSKTINGISMGSEMSITRLL